jgi:hypothetical protein
LLVGGVNYGDCYVAFNMTFSFQPQSLMEE